MKKFLLAIIFCGAFSYAGFSQQDPQFSMYMFNGLYLNPAYAGSQEVVSFTAVYRRQWVKLNGSPHTGSLAFHTPFKRTNNAIGAIITFDKIGATNQYNFSLSYAYRIKLSDKVKLSLGLQGIIAHYVANLTEVPLPDPNNADPNFMEDKSLFEGNFGAGIYIYGERFYVGAATPHLLNSSLKNSFQFVGTDETARKYKHYMATAGYVFGKPLAFIKFKPSIMFKFVESAPADLDLNASFLIADRFWVGASYRLGGDKNDKKGESVIGILEFKATPHLRIGYSYDYTLSKLQDINNGTHEIMIGYDFGFDKERFVHPRYVKYF